jgi:PD-(D/E)XK nuclease superfamily protein
VLTTTQKGAIAEMAIAHEAIKLGIGVSKPLWDLRYDLVFDTGDERIRVQSFAAYCQETDRWYFTTIEESAGRASSSCDSTRRETTSWPASTGRGTSNSALN